MGISRINFISFIDAVKLSFLQSLFCLENPPPRPKEGFVMQHTNVYSKGRFVLITLTLLLGILVTSGIVSAQSATQQLSVSIKPEIQGKIQMLQEDIQNKGATFTVGYNSASEYTIPQLCGLVEPEGWRLNARFEATQRYLSAGSLPSSFDWRQLEGGNTPVRNQGSCGSCWAFSTVAPLEILISYHCGNVVDLSEQYLVSCNDEPGDKWGCGGGWFAHDYHEWKYSSAEGETDFGAVLETSFPYRASDVACNGPHSHPYKISDWRFIESDWGGAVPPVAAIKAAIQTYGPVSAAICVGTNFHNYEGGIFNISESCSDVVNHAITLVGWVDDGGEDGGYWILKNSWGTSWGESGYMRIRYSKSLVGYAANYINFTTANCPVTVPPTLAVSPTSVSAGATVTAAFSNVANPSSGDWIGLYAQGAVDTALKDYIYASSCTKTRGTARAAGSCQYSLPASLAGGTYELRLFSNNSWTRLAVCNTFTVTASYNPPTITVTPTSVLTGGTVTADFGSVANPSSQDWIGLYVQGAADASLRDYFYSSSCTKTPGTARAAGSCQYTVPAGLSGGTYELRLFSNGSWTLLAVGNTFTVTASYNPPTITVTPTSVSAGGTVTADFSSVANPSSQDWIGLYVAAADDTAWRDYLYSSSCTKTPGTARAAGFCQYSVPAGLSGGTYELRLFSNGGWTRLAVGNTFTVTASYNPPTITVTPTSVSAGGTVTADFSSVANPSSQDWIGLYVAGADDTAWRDYLYSSSCTKTPGTARAAGSCQYTMPAGLSGGTYELRLFSNGGWTRLAVGNTFAVTSSYNPPAITVNPTNVAPGGTVSADFSSVASPSSQDWIGLYVAGADNTAWRDYYYSSSCTKTAGTARAAGSCQYTVPASLSRGTYELRLFSNGGWTRLAVSNTFLVY